MKRVLIWIIGAAFSISWLFLLGYYCISQYGPFGPVISDVSKRLEAPDHRKTALLFRRKGFDLNFVVKIEEGLRISTLYFSPDYNTDSTIDWNERIQWSHDSSLLVFTTDAVPPYFPDKIWAFDFRKNVAVTDKEEILSLLNQRNGK